MTVIERPGHRDDPVVARRVAVRTFRPYRMWPAVIVAAVIAAVAALVAAEAVSSIAGSPLRFLPYEQAADRLAGLRWSDPAVLAGAAVLCAAGIVLLVTALLPGRGGYLPLRTDDPDLVVGLSRGGLRRTLAAAACDVDGVRAATVTVRRRRVRVRADTPARDDDGTRGAVRAAVEQRLATLGPIGGMRVRVRVRYGKG